MTVANHVTGLKLIGHHTGQEGIAEMIKATVNFIDRANLAIQQFVEEPRNKALSSGTGAFSTPFRGSLFGTDISAEIEEHLRTRSADFLWIGSNPNVPESLESIVRSIKNGTSDEAMKNFCRQRDSGRYSEQTWSADGTSKTNWDPIHSPPNGGWQFYRELLSEAGNLDSVAMANFLPWGSESFSKLTTTLQVIDASLLARIIEFSSELNAMLAGELRPRWIVVPFSLSCDELIQRLATTEIALNRAASPQWFNVNLDTRTFNYAIAEAAKSLSARILYVPHPSSLRLDQTKRQEVFEHMLATMKRA